MVEKFDTKFAMNYPNDYQDIRFQKYSQNKTKEWKDPYQAYNAPIVQTYGITFNDFYKLNQYIFNDFEKGMIDKFVKKYTQPFESNDDDYLIAFTPFDIYNLNRETWYNRFNWNADYALYLKYLESKFQEVNIMNRFFMYLFNDYWYNFILDYVKRNVILYKSYFIWKYRIVNIFNSKEQVNGLPKNRIFDVVLVTTRDEGLIAFEFFLRGLFVYKGENYEMDNLEINYVANYTLDKILMREGIDKNNLKFNLNPLYKNDDPIPSADAEKIYAKEKEKYFEERNFLDYSYACFTYKRNSLDPIATPMFATDKNDCQNKYTLSGQEKPAGVWDRPCQKNEDCLFFRRNKNYDNDFGKCTKGFCELPMNMRNLGYHYYIDSPRRKPLCYNCKSDR